MSETDESVNVGFAQRRRRRSLILAGVILLVAGVAAWQYYDSRYPSWYEEVELPGGRKVTVEQKREYQPGYGTHQTWLTFRLPEAGRTVTWNEKLYPVMLGVAESKVFVVGRPRGGQQYQTYVYPRYMYVAFELQGQEFVRIPFLSVPEALRLRENVRWCFPGGEDKRVFDLRANPAWCDDMDPKWPTPQIVDLRIRIAESLSWAGIYTSGRQPVSE